MKHTIKITLIILAMFLVTQLLGLFVANSYLPHQEIVFNSTTGQYENVTIPQPLPYGIQPPEISAAPSLISLIISFTIAIVLLLILAKYKWKFLIRAWFFIVVVLALSLALNAFTKGFLPFSYLFVLLAAIPLAYLKIYRPSIIIHNFTELLIYPGIAAVFIPILIDNEGWLIGKFAYLGINLSTFWNTWPILIFLVLISIYDMWAVWKSKLMIKMAKFQMNELKIFGGFFIPYMTKKVREKIANFKKSKSKKGKPIRVNLAILGGGDVVFPIITAGVFMAKFGIIPALFIIIGASIALLILQILSEKKKFYPAMPFISSGIFLALLVWRLFFF